MIDCGSVSGTLIQIPRHGTVLLDCGEGTWGQLARSFGNDPARTSGVWAVLRDLKCIYLSHMHGDHHMGLSRILQMRTLVRSATHAAYASSKLRRSVPLLFARCDRHRRNRSTSSATASTSCISRSGRSLRTSGSQIQTASSWSFLIRSTGGPRANTPASSRKTSRSCLTGCAPPSVA